MEYHIPEDEHSNVMGSFWTMLRELETTADNDNDPILKHWVENWYAQWNRITNDDKSPVWKRR